LRRAPGPDRDAPPSHDPASDDPPADDPPADRPTTGPKPGARQSGAGAPCSGRPVGRRAASPVSGKRTDLKTRGALVLQAAYAFMRNDQLRVGLLALIVGAAAAYGAILFRMIADVVAWLVFGAGEEAIPEAARQMSALSLIATTTLTGLALGLACRFLLPDKLPQGVAEVIEAAALRNGRMSWRHGWSAALLSAYSIGVGGSVGREGPIVHLGASMAAQVARWLQMGPNLARTLLGCGVAAAVAAAFNAPIAGVFFALEVVVGHYGLGAFSPVVIASLIGTIVTRVHIGDQPAFGLSSQAVQSFWEVPAFLLLGVVAAIAAILLMRGIALVQAAHERIGTPVWLRPAVGGAGLGCIAVFFPQVLGVGYEMTTAALTDRTPLELLIALALAKIAATSLCHGSLYGGGMFSPSLAIGALTGGAFGMVAASLAPTLGSQPTVYAIIGMGAAAAPVLGAPISTVIMIFELTTDYGVTFAVMAAVAISSLVTRGLYGDSYFHWQLKRRGISVEGHRELGLLRARRVTAVMRDDHVTVAHDAALEHVRDRFRSSHAPVFVVDAEHRLLGSIGFEELADAVLAEKPDPDLKAVDLVRRSKVVLTPDDDLATALNLCRSEQEEHIPVVRSRDTLDLVGEVRLRDLLSAYNQALLHARRVEQGRA